MICHSRIRFRRALAGLAVAAGLGQAGPIHAADFFEKTDLRIIVGSTVGGGYDTYGRLLARHISNHIPGKPTVIVSNKVGAAGLLVANELYNVYPRDGSTI